MRRRVKNFSIDSENNAIILNSSISIDDIRLIIDETQKVVICSSMQKDNITISDNKITVNASVCTLAKNDNITLEIDTADSIEDLRGSYYADTGQKKTTLATLRTMLDAMDIETLLENKRNLAAVLKDKGSRFQYQDPANPSMNELITSAQQVRVNEFISTGSLEDAEYYTPENYKLPDEWKTWGNQFAHAMQVAKLFQEDITSGAFNDEFSSTRYVSRVNPDISYNGFYLMEYPITADIIKYSDANNAYYITLTKGPAGDAYLVGLKTKQLVEWSSDETENTKNIYFQENDLPTNGHLFVFGLFQSDNYSVTLSDLIRNSIIFGGHPASINIKNITAYQGVTNLNDCEMDIIANNVERLYFKQTSGYSYTICNALSLPNLTHKGNYVSGTIDNSPIVYNAKVYDIELPNLQTMSAGGILQNCAFSGTLKLPNLTRVAPDTAPEGGQQGRAYIELYSNVVRIEMPKLTYFYGDGINRGCSYTQSIYAPLLEEVNFNYNNGGVFVISKTISFPKLKTAYIGGTNTWGFSFETLDLPALETLTMDGIYGGFSFGDIYLPALKTLITTGSKSLQQGGTNNHNVYLPSLESHPRNGGRFMFGYAYNGGVNDTPKPKSVIVGAKGTPDQEIAIDAQAAIDCNTWIEIGDKENIDKGLEPRWKPKQKISIINFTGISAKSIALGILDRLDDNSDGTPIPIVIGAKNLERINADETYAPYVQAARDKGYTIS